MKKIHTLVAVCVLLAGGFLSLPSCSDTRAGNNETPSESNLAAAAIPYLKGRKAGLGTPDEIAHVASIYDEKKALLKKDPNNAEAYLALAELFINEARITGEHPYYYPAALKMIEMIPNLAGRSNDIRFQAAYFKASVQLSQHEFQKALTTGQEGLQLFPKNAGIHGVLIDANVELGNYEEAVRLSDAMVGIRPDLRSYSRISYLREIHGDPDGAIEAMNLAVDAAMPGYEQSAWCRLTLAKLYENYGKLDEAKMHYTMILEERPEYPFAYSGLASIAMKQGNKEEAEKLVDKAIDLIPEVSFYEQKAELMRETGREDVANQLSKDVMTMMAEDQASGHMMDLELAIAQLHLQHDVQAAKIYAEKAYAARPNNIDVNAAMAEVHYHMGDFAKAWEYMNVALRTGSKDPAKNCLAGLIEVKNGKKAEGVARIKEALSINPYLDHPLASEAKAML
jgi:tetratricopeptide (TPR) repeat protein